MSTGINIGDIKRVTQTRPPITRNLSNLTQRLRRAVRAIMEQGQAITFLQYYYFNDEKDDPLPPSVAPGVAPIVATAGPSSDLVRRNPSRTRMLPSRLRKSQTPGEEAGVAKDEDGDDFTNASSVVNEVSDPAFGTRKKKPKQYGANGLKVWNKNEIQAREKIPPIWLALVNSGCPRKVINEYL